MAETKKRTKKMDKEYRDELAKIFFENEYQEVHSA